MLNVDCTDTLAVTVSVQFHISVLCFVILMIKID